MHGMSMKRPHYRALYLEEKKEREFFQRSYRSLLDENNKPFYKKVWLSITTFFGALVA